jgi:hypothetical protein
MVIINPEVTMENEPATTRGVAKKSAKSVKQVARKMAVKKAAAKRPVKKAFPIHT